MTQSSLCEYTENYYYCHDLFFIIACSDLNAPSTTLIELIIFVSMGSGILLVLPEVLAELCREAIVLATLGLMFYGVGIIFFILGEYKPIYHTIWHLFVVAAAAVHWFCIYFFVVQVSYSCYMIDSAWILFLMCIVMC